MSGVGETVGWWVGGEVGQVEQRARGERVETLGILDSCFTGKAISSSRCHIGNKRQRSEGGKNHGEWLHSQKEEEDLSESSED